MTELEDRLRATFTDVATSTTIPEAPRVPSARTRRPWIRRTVTGCLAFALVGGGLSTAGELRGIWGDATPGAYAAIPSTDRVVVTAPGRYGALDEVHYADASDDGYCIEVVLLGVPPLYSHGGGGCNGPRRGPDWTGFGRAYFAQGGSDSRQGPTGTSFQVHVPGATRVALVSGGNSRDLPIGSAWTAGWASPEQMTAGADLVGYDSAGHEIGRITLR